MNMLSRLLFLGDLGEIHVTTPNQGNESITNFNIVVQVPLGRDETRPQIIETKQISNEI